MKATSEIVPDSEIERVHANANFGSMTKRQVVDEGVLQYAFGYCTGHTMMMILYEHGLITVPKGYKANLTQKGKEYLHAMFADVPLSRIMALRPKAAARSR